MTLTLSKIAMRLVGAAIATAASAKAHDAAIDDGRLMDPETMYDSVANIGITDARIAAITRDAVTGAETIDARGHVAAAGFIDAHSHGACPMGYEVGLADGATSAMDLAYGNLGAMVDPWCADREGVTQVNHGTASSDGAVRSHIVDGQTGDPGDAPDGTDPRGPNNEWIQGFKYAQGTSPPTPTPIPPTPPFSDGSGVLRVHPDNPHYFMYKGKAIYPLSSTEHYGALINLDFDYIKYFDKLAQYGADLTRTFTGSYIEDMSDFNIGSRNSLAVLPSRIIAPWARSSQGGGYGGNKWDLNDWNEEYFARLESFLTEAENRGIIVEITMFSMQYGNNQWSHSPLNAINNINGVGNVGQSEFVRATGSLLDAQKKMVAKIVQEVNRFDNVFFEICNECKSDPDNLRWTQQLVNTIVETERFLPKKHPIAMNYIRQISRTAIPDNLDILNAHYTYVDDNWIGMMEMLDMGFYDYGYILALDEPRALGRAGVSPESQRLEQWETLIGGGGSYTGLSFRYTPADEDGDAENDQILKNLQQLRKFLASIDPIRMKPDKSLVKGGISKSAHWRILAEPGQQYALYIHRGEGGSNSGWGDALYSPRPGSYTSNPEITLPAGNYDADWIDPTSGNVLASEDVTHSSGTRTFNSPTYRLDIALRILKR